MLAGTRRNYAGNYSGSWSVPPASEPTVGGIVTPGSQHHVSIKRERDEDDSLFLPANSPDLENPDNAEPNEEQDEDRLADLAAIEANKQGPARKKRKITKKANPKVPGMYVQRQKASGAFDDGSRYNPNRPKKVMKATRPLTNIVRHRRVETVDLTGDDATVHRSRGYIDLTDNAPFTMTGALTNREVVALDSDDEEQQQEGEQQEEAGQREVEDQKLEGQQIQNQQVEEEQLKDHQLEYRQLENQQVEEEQPEDSQLDNQPIEEPQIKDEPAGPLQDQQDYKYQLGQGFGGEDHNSLPA
jgi:hypothetical protein